MQTRASTGILAPADKLPNCLAHARPTDQRGCIIWPQRLNSRAWTQGRSCLAGRRLQPRLPADALAQPVSPRALATPSGRLNDSWIVLFENFTSPAEATAIIQAGERRGYKRDSRTSALARNSSQTWCSRPCRTLPLVQRVLGRLEHVTGAGARHFETMQLVRYRRGEFFRTHHDSHTGSYRDSAQGHRVLTAFMYLSTPAAGGETAFPRHPGVSPVEARAGRLLVWPNVHSDRVLENNLRMKHEARPVRAGVKYGANIWLRMYPQGLYRGPSICTKAEASATKSGNMCT